MKPPDFRGSAEGDAAVALRDVACVFKSHVAVAKATFRIPRGELHGFVGPNGAGKTTLLKAIATLLVPTRGTIQVFGHDTVADAPAVRRRIGFMPDHFSLYRRMTVHEYLDFFAAAYGQSLKQRDRVLGEVLALTDLGPRRDSLVASLSRGLQQRVGLARVLLNDPDLLLLDEPAAGLDPRARIELMEMLRALRSMGKSIVISSHILGELGDLCDAVTIIDRGSIRYTGSMRDLLELQQSRRAFRLRLADPPADVDAVLASLPDVVGVERVEEQDEFRVELAEDAPDANRLLRALLEHGLRVQQIAPDRKQLHQVFLDLTTAGVS